MNRRLFLQMAGSIPLFSLIGIKKTLGMTAVIQNHEFDHPIRNQLLSSHVLARSGPGDLILIGSRPGMGKSAVALNLVHELTLGEKKSVLYCSYEQSNQNLMKRLMCINTGISTATIFKEEFGSKDTMKFANSCDKFAKSKLLVTDENLNTQQLLDKINRNINYVFVDYLNLVPTHKKYPSRSQQVAGVLNELKKMAVSKNTVVIVLAQLNRGVEGRLNRRPTPEDIRETRDLNSIDKMYFVYRTDYYADKSLTGQENVNMEIIEYDKSKNFVGTLMAKFNKTNSRISCFESDLLG